MSQMSPIEMYERGGKSLSDAPARTQETLRLAEEAHNASRATQPRTGPPTANGRQMTEPKPPACPCAGCQPLAWGERLFMDYAPLLACLFSLVVVIGMVLIAHLAH